jgi:hypothetical protein
MDPNYIEYLHKRALSEKDPEKRLAVEGQLKAFDPEGKIRRKNDEVQCGSNQRRRCHKATDLH